MRRDMRRLLIFVPLLFACGGAPAAQPSTAKAAAPGGAEVVVATAEWCEPCNELHQRFLDTAEGKAALAGHTVREIDIESPDGSQTAAQLRVLGYPTTLVLRQFQGRAVEVGRIEGFDSAAEFKATLAELLARERPGAVCAAQVPAALPPPAERAPVLATLQCAAELLHTDLAERAARIIAEALASQPLLDAAAAWPEGDRLALLAAFRLLGRYQTRVLGQHADCAATFGKMLAWPGTPEKSKSGSLYWRAKCTLRGGDPAGAQQQWQAFLAAKPNDADAEELAADFMVHEAVKQPWGPPLALQLLQDVVRQKPQNDWAHYLLFRLHTAAGRAVEAQAELDAALKIKPDAAIYLRHKPR